MIRSRIVASGRALGSERIDNKTLGERLGISPHSIEKRTGIKCRFWVTEKESTSDLAVRAAQDALVQAQWHPLTLDLIVLSTTSPDFPFPATACLVQQKLLAHNASSFDINASCTGFLYALSIADHAIRSQTVRRVLVVASEVKSRWLKMNDPSTAILFGDGAGAILLEESAGASGIDTIFLHADGTKHSLIRLPAGGSRQPLSWQTLSDQAHTIEMKGPSLFRIAVRRFGEALDEALTSGWDKSNVDWFVFHQANKRILEAIVNKAGIPKDKVLLTLPEVGNTSSSALPIALDIGKNDCFHPGNRIVLIGFGGGITWGSARLVW